MLFLLLLCKTKRLDGVYIIVVKIANLELRIFLQMLVDVHFFSFSPHSTSKKETFEPFWTKIPIGEPCQNQDPNKALKKTVFDSYFPAENGIWNSLMWGRYTNMVPKKLPQNCPFIVP